MTDVCLDESNIFRGKDEFPAELQDKLTALSEKLGSNTMKHWIPVWTKNYAENEHLFKGKPFIGLNDSGGLSGVPNHKGKPAICVGAGPSLKKNVHLLKNVDRNKCIIICSDRALRELAKHGVKPHYVSSLDGWDQLHKFFDGYEWVRRMNWSEDNVPVDHTDTTLIVSTCTHPNTIKAWKGNFLFFNSNFVGGQDKVLDDEIQMFAWKLQGVETDLPLTEFLVKHNTNRFCKEAIKILNAENQNILDTISRVAENTEDLSEVTLKVHHNVFDIRDRSKGVDIRELDIKDALGLIAINKTTISNYKNQIVDLNYSWKYPLIGTGGNAGTFAIIMTEYMRCNPVAFLGMDFSEDLSTVPHPFQHVEVDEKGDAVLEDGKEVWIARGDNEIKRSVGVPFNDLMKKSYVVFNDFWEQYYGSGKIIHRYVPAQFLDAWKLIGRMTELDKFKNKTFINCSEGGICYGKKIHAMKLSEFIEDYKVGIDGSNVH